MKTMRVKTPKGKPVKERILEKAEELFYRQGYQATGINQIIAESGVAKASFYDHFPSKDALCVAYLKGVNSRELAHFREAMSKCRNPLDKLFCPIETVMPWLVETDFKGCTFLNMVPEVVDPEDPIRREAAAFYAEFEKIIREAAEELIRSAPAKYGHLKAAQVAKDYVTLFAGGLELAALYHSKAPMENVLRLVRLIVK